MLSWTREKITVCPWATEPEHGDNSEVVDGVCVDCGFDTATGAFLDAPERSDT